MGKKKASQASGGRRLKVAGKWPQLLGWPAEARATIEAAAKIDGRKMTQFVMHHALRAAEKILEKSADQA